MQKYKGRVKGITLIALVVTVVVLLILAGISINLILGQNGIISKAKDAKRQTIIGREKEAIILAYTGCQIDSETLNVTAENMEEELINNGENVDVSGTDILEITFNETGNKYEISQNGTITKVEPMPIYADESMIGQAIPELFDYEIIGDGESASTTIESLSKKTARITKIKPKYCNGQGYNIDTDENDLVATNYAINYEGNVISDTLVIPYQVKLDSDGKIDDENGAMYTITEVCLEVYGKDEDNDYIGLPEVRTIIYPNTIKKITQDNIDNYFFEYYGYGDISDNNVLENVILSESLESIGNLMFYNCNSLTGITIPNSVTSIGDYAFYKCDNLTAINIKNTEDSILGAPWGADHANIIWNFTGEITIPSDIINIEVGQYDHNTGIESVIIENGVTTIGDWAFEGCTNLKSITIPNSVTYIGYEAFDECTNLANVNISNSTLLNNGAYVFFNTLWWENKRNERADKLVIIDNVLVDGQICSGNITIPESVTSIKDEAFADCTNLTSITIPGSVTSIGWDVFARCTNLENITIPNSITSIGEGAFSGTLWLNNKRAINPLVIVNNILIDGQICSGNITIPNEVTSIGNYAFYENENLTSITIPNSVTSIREGAFSYCSNLTSITIPGSVTSIGGGAFFETPWLDNKRAIDSLVIVNNILIDGGTCTGNITIPNVVTSIGAGAFSENENLTGITIPSSVTSIGDFTFGICNNLTSITIPHSVINVGSEVFYWDSELINIYVQGFTSKPAGWANDWNSECSATVHWGQ